jgi:hypothetical protein
MASKNFLWHPQENSFNDRNDVYIDVLSQVALTDYISELLKTVVQD